MEQSVEFEPPPKPTAEDYAGMERVMAYSEYMKMLSCEHPTITTDGISDTFRCAECGRPMRMLSDVQLAKREGKG